MRARVLYFGMLKEVAGQAAEEAEFPAGADLRAVFDHAASRYPRLRDLAGSIVVAKNQEFADLTTKLEDGDEVAFLPPVSGGAAAASASLVEASRNGSYFALTRHA